MYSDYIVYVDESGDHGLKKVDAAYPYFCLCFCIFKKDVYINKIVPEFQQLKFKYWGHDTVILHEHDIRKSMASHYSIFSNPNTLKSFMNDISKFMKNSPFHIAASMVNKNFLVENFSKVAKENIYAHSLFQCVMQLNNLLESQNVSGIIDIICESRGHEEDKMLRTAFNLILEKHEYTMKKKPHLKGAYKGLINDITMKYRLHFVSKKSNQAGLQIADLTARPITLGVLRSHQKNRAFDILKPKILNI